MPQVRVSEPDGVGRGVTECPPSFFNCPTVQSITFLTGVAVLEASPPQNYAFSYTSYEQPFIIGSLNGVVLPGSGDVSYNYSIQNVWRPDFPIIFTGGTIAQFGFFPVLGVSTRKIDLKDGKVWMTEYQRLNTAGCASTNPGACFANPQTVILDGPYDVSDPTVMKSRTIHTLNGTPASSGSPGETDGTLHEVTAYAGAGAQAVPVRSATYDYEFSEPDHGCMAVGTFDKAHYADNMRVSRTTTTFLDDGATPHAFKAVDNCGWAKIATAP